MMFMVNPENKHKVYIKWRVSVYPEVSPMFTYLLHFICKTSKTILGM